jgi:predicted small secreted protein
VLLAILDQAMKSIFASVVLLSAIVLSSCNSHSTSQKEIKDSTVTKEIKTKTASEKLLGTWAYLDKSGFELSEVNDSSNALFYFFIKRDSTPGGNYYYKSAGTIEKWDRYSMSVKT